MPKTAAAIKTANDTSASSVRLICECVTKCWNFPVHQWMERSNWDRLRRISPVPDSLEAGERMGVSGIVHYDLW